MCSPGTVDFSIDGVDSVAVADEILVVGAGEPHKFRNSGSGLLEMIAIHAPPVMITEWLEATIHVDIARRQRRARVPGVTRKQSCCRATRVPARIRP